MLNRRGARNDCGAKRTLDIRNVDDRFARQRGASETKVADFVIRKRRDYLDVKHECLAKAVAFVIDRPLLGDPPGRCNEAAQAFGRTPAAYPRYAEGDQAARSRYRFGREPPLGWYKLAKWRRIREDAVLVRDCYICRHCHRVIAKKGEAHVDHVEPDGGDPTRFWSGALQCLCQSCHAQKTECEGELPHAIRHRRT